MNIGFISLIQWTESEKYLNSKIKILSKKPQNTFLSSFSEHSIFDYVSQNF